VVCHGCAYSVCGLGSGSGWEREVIGVFAFRTSVPDLGMYTGIACDRMRGFQGG
jgi:hypothetical protein